MRQMGVGNLPGAGKLAEHSINGCHVQRRHQRFQLGEQDIDQAGNGLFESGSVLNLVKSVSCK